MSAPLLSSASPSFAFAVWVWLRTKFADTLRLDLCSKYEAAMAEPVYPSLEQQQEGGQKIGFEGLGEEQGSFSVQFTPSAPTGDPKEQLTEAPQASYRTFEGDQPQTQSSSEDIKLIERERPTSPTEEEKVK